MSRTGAERRLAHPGGRLEPVLLSYAVYISIRKHSRAYIHACMHTCIHACIRTYIPIGIYIYGYV